jgi:hypothetical protein
MSNLKPRFCKINVKPNILRLNLFLKVNFINTYHINTIHSIFYFFNRFSYQIYSFYDIVLNGDKNDKRISKIIKRKEN